MNQALIGELTKAKTLEEERGTQKQLLDLREEIARDVVEKVTGGTKKWVVDEDGR